MIDIKNKLAAFCDNVVYLKEKNNISETEMAKIMGISPKYLNQIENGTVPAKMSSAVLIRMSEYFNVSVDMLLQSCKRE